MLAPKEQGSPRNSQANVPQEVDHSGKNVKSFTEGERQELKLSGIKTEGDITLRGGMS